ncbi:MAG: NAD(P)-binding protein [Clostridiales Family XIII bacterium]|nr:NAD(P)-binding protein [Clostridiales Family XIII bacterium]
MKQVSDYLAQFDRCLAGEPAYCMAACPFHLDVRAFTESVEQGRISAAYRLYRDATGFPAIASALCARPCEAACPLRGTEGGAIRLSEIEREVVREATDRKPSEYNLPPRGKRVAVIGAGLAGLACALRLAQKRVAVEVFEASGEIGGGGWGSGTAAAAITKEDALAEIALQFGDTEYTLHLNTAIGAREDVNALGFDAAFVCTGAGGESFGLPVDADEPCLLDPRDKPEGDNSGVIPAQTPTDVIPGLTRNPKSESKADAQHPASAGGAASTGATRGGLADLSAGAGVGWFAGGARTGREGAEALAHGLSAAAAIDAFLRTGKLAFPDGRVETKLPPKAAGDLGKPHAGPEAARCLRCRCDACMVFADLPAYTGKWPLRIRDEVFATALPGKSEVKATPARRLINMDNLSGVFETVCPAGIDLDGLLLAGRQSLHRQEKMPWAFHEFHLRDMEHADSIEAAAAIFHSKQSGGLVFFPGCQLGASDPGLVAAAWDALLKLDAAGAIQLEKLVLRCCGAPAKWAGDEELFQQKLKGILLHNSGWRTSPTFVMACPSCMRVFEEHLPEVKTVSLYEVLAEHAGALGALHPPESPKGPYAVFDACAGARLKPEKADALRASVRRLAAIAGLETEELPIQKDVARCCGFGGQPDFADPGFAKAVAGSRAEESERPYLCYCSNCRDAFLKNGKEAMHALELLAPPGAEPGQEAAGRLRGMAEPGRAPTASQRRENRKLLKEYLWATSPEDTLSRLGPRRDPPPRPGESRYYNLEIPPELLAQMDADHILVEDVHAIIVHMRQTRQSIYRPRDGRHFGNLTIGQTTYWISYSDKVGRRGVCLVGPYGEVGSDRLVLTSAYLHRIAFVPEEAWNALHRWTAAGTHKPAGAEKKIPEEDEALVCEFCGVDMEPMEAEFAYLGRSFRHRVVRCPQCGAPYIPEALARGRIRIVEMALEDK